MEKFNPKKPERKKPNQETKNTNSKEEITNRRKT